MKSGIVIEQFKRMLSTAVPTIHESQEESKKFEIKGCIYCFVFGENLGRADVPDVHWKYRTRLLLSGLSLAACKDWTVSSLWLPCALGGFFYQLKFRKLGVLSSKLTPSKVN